MKIALVANCDFRIADATARGWSVSRFAISPDETSYSKLLDSSFSTPARYVQEMYYRLCCTEKSSETSSKFIFNPFYETDKQAFILALRAVTTCVFSSDIVLVADKDGLVVAYLFPPSLTLADARYLVLLSATYAHLDGHLLSQLFSVNVHQVTIPRLSLAYAGNNGFAQYSHQRVYEWVAQHAIRVLGRAMVSKDKVEARKQRDSIPFFAFMPHHAGDVLFLALACERSETQIMGVVTNRVYADIARDNAESLAVFPISAPVANRDEKFRHGQITPDVEYLEQVADQLNEGVFYCYCRSSRDYNLTKRHLIDHFAFSIGAHLCKAGDSLLTKELMPARYTGLNSSGSKKVLLHFDGGWPMKVYPKPLQNELIESLHEKGYEITLLVAEMFEHPKCAVTTFTGYGALVSLLREQQLIVGMDSFPCHYAAHVLGLPTICLFSSTRPANSDAPRTPHYVALERGLACRPCYAIARCPIYGGDACRNFVAPTAVIEAVHSILSQPADGREVGERQTKIRSDWGCNSSEIPNSRARSVAVSLRWAWWHSVWAFLSLPVKYYLRQVTHEFFAFAKQEGYAKTSLRAMRYLLRKLRAR